MAAFDHDYNNIFPNVFGSSPLSSPILSSSPLQRFETASVHSRGRIQETPTYGHQRQTSSILYNPNDELTPIIEESNVSVEPEEAEDIGDAPNFLPDPNTIGLDAVLEHLKSLGLTWGDLVEYLADPRNKQGRTRYHGFFKNEAQVQRVLALWTSWRNKKGRHTIHSWIVEYMCRHMNKEGRASTRDGFLQSRLKPIDQNFILGFSMSAMYNHLRNLCPTFLKLVYTFSTTARQLRTMSDQALARKQLVSRVHHT